MTVVRDVKGAFDKSFFFFLKGGGGEVCDGVPGHPSSIAEGTRPGVGNSSPGGPVCMQVLFPPIIQAKLANWLYTPRLLHF